jgi:predicted nucleotidyltransferase
LSSVAIKSLDVAEIRRAVDAYASDLFARAPAVEEVVVFGSFASGRWAPGSDVDLLIVLSRDERPVRERIPELLPGRFPVGLDLFPFTREELADRAGSPLLAAAAASTWRYRR